MAKANERGAGRKPIFTEEQITEIRKKREQGVTVSALAKEYGVSRQTLSGYLNKKEQQMDAIIESYRVWRDLNRSFKNVDPIDYTMRMDFMCEDKCCTQILINFLRQQIEIINTTDNATLRAFGNKVKPTWADFEEFLEERCVPRSRDNIRMILEDLNMDYYDPLSIVEETQGRMGEDMMWIKITRLKPMVLKDRKKVF